MQERLFRILGAIPSSILCIAGRGALDEAAASMLVRLLGKHGMGGRQVGYGEVSREAIQDLDMTGVAMACVSYLDISGTPAHLRYLMQAPAPTPTARHADTRRTLASRRLHADGQGSSAVHRRRYLRDLAGRDGVVLRRGGTVGGRALSGAGFWTGDESRRLRRRGYSNQEFTVAPEEWKPNL